MSDDGVLWALSFDGSGAAKAVRWEELDPSTSEGPPLWLHLASATPALREWLSASSGLDEITLGAFFAEETRPRYLRSAAAHVVFLRAVNLTPGAEPDDMISLRIAVHGRLLVSFRQERLETTHQIREALEAGSGPQTTTELFVRLVVGLTQRIQPVLDNLHDLTDDLEASLGSRETARQRADLANLRQQSIALRRYLAPQRLALANLMAEPPPWLEALGRTQLREVGDATLRYVEDLDELRERAMVIHDELSNRVAEQLNARMYALSVVTLVFLPLGLLTGLLGINVGGMPGAENPVAFWVVVGILLAISGLIGAWLRALRWI